MVVSGTVPMLFDEVMALDGAHLVRACYHEILQRNPDQEGLANHSAALAHGVPKAALIVAIAASEEACLSGRALSPLAVRARDRVYLDDPTVSAWMRLPPVMKHYRRRKEAEVAAKVADVQRIAREKEGLGNAPPVPKPSPIEVIRIASEVFETKVLNAGRADLGVPTLWFDLTTCLQWTQGVVGIVRAELEIAVGLYSQDPSVRYSVQVDQGFTEVSIEEISWLLNADNVVDAYMTFFGRYGTEQGNANRVKVYAPNTDGFFHCYRTGDIILSVGWMDSQKEKYFSQLKEINPGIYISYLVYDLILLLKDTKHFYDPSGCERFRDYIKWISYNCDVVLFGGNTAKSDTENYFQTQGWPTPPGVAVKFGTDIVRANVSQDKKKQLLHDLGVDGQFILTVGTIEPRKNHETLIRAYLLALEELGDSAPQLVIVGKPMWRADDLMSVIARNPRLKDRVLCLRPTDHELAALYESCLFTVLPSIYEGWSLTLPESLGQGKFCICSDTPPLREIGGVLVDYVAPFDVRGWAEKIVLFALDQNALAARTKRVQKEWPALTWADTVDMAVKAVRSHAAHFAPIAPRSSDILSQRPWSAPPVWMDLTLSYLQWGGGLSGIVRAELEIARNLKALYPDTRFFAYEASGNYFFEITADLLLWLVEGKDLSKAYLSFQRYWKGHEDQATGSRDPFKDGGQSVIGARGYLGKFPASAIVFFAGIDSDGSGQVYRTEKFFGLVKPDQAVLSVQLIYDLTPFLFPQFHTPPTTEGFVPFFQHVSNTFDFLVYGGATAQRDGIDIQTGGGLRSPSSAALKFGSDIVTDASTRRGESFADEETLADMGVFDDFLLMVGTIEPRKNHEAIYKAYLTLLQDERLERPLQIVFAGKPGWNCADFLAIIGSDERVKDRILMLSPTDAQLDVLYRRCLFTLLPSFYEGWSLTLPESLGYGKFCLTSDVDPLREIAGDLVDYVHPLDTFAWADRIAHYVHDQAALDHFERRIRNEWRPVSWRESTEALLDILHDAHRDQYGHLFAPEGQA